jgi:hypothetical protein
VAAAARIAAGIAIGIGTMVTAGADAAETDEGGTADPDPMGRAVNPSPLSS